MVEHRTRTSERYYQNSKNSRHFNECMHILDLWLLFVSTRVTCDIIINNFYN